MRIDEILRHKRTLSFEVFPPKKSDTETEALYRTIDVLASLRPDFISVTFGAGGSNARNVAEIAGYIKSRGIEPLAHITGGTLSPRAVDEVVADLQKRGVENILALRGDPPVDASVPFCEHFPHATDLLAYLRAQNFCMGGACYPEGHTECETLYDDLLSLKRKQENGAGFLISQMFFDNSYYYRLLSEAAKAGVSVPLLAGIMPLTSAKNLGRIKRMCGSTIPIDFRNMIEVYASDSVVLREIGLNYAVYQIIDLIAKGAPGIHLYVMNRADTAVEIARRLEKVFHAYFGQ